MRALSGAKNPNGVADPIIEHPAVRYMLLFQKAIAEGGCDSSQSTFARNLHSVIGCTFCLMPVTCWTVGDPWCMNAAKCKTLCTMQSSLATPCVAFHFHRVVARSLIACPIRNDVCVFVSSAVVTRVACTRTTQETAKKLDDKLGFLTPILKGFLSESGVEASNMGIQVYGGHGYIKSNKQEQIARDVRISALWEGTTQIQVHGRDAQK